MFPLHADTKTGLSPTENEPHNVSGWCTLHSLPRLSHSPWCPLHGTALQGLDLLQLRKVGSYIWAALAGPVPQHLCGACMTDFCAAPEASRGPRGWSPAGLLAWTDTAGALTVYLILFRSKVAVYVNLCYPQEVLCLYYKRVVFLC